MPHTMRWDSIQRYPLNTHVHRTVSGIPPETPPGPRPRPWPCPVGWLWWPASAFVRLFVWRGSVVLKLMRVVCNVMTLIMNHFGVSANIMTHNFGAPRRNPSIMSKIMTHNFVSAKNMTHNFVSAKIVTHNFGPWGAL